MITVDVKIRCDVVTCNTETTVEVPVRHDDDDRAFEAGHARAGADAEIARLRARIVELELANACLWDENAELRAGDR